MIDQTKLGRSVEGFDVLLVLLNYHFSFKWPRTDAFFLFIGFVVVIE